MGSDFFLALPPPTAFLLLTSLLSLPTIAHAVYPLPRQTPALASATTTVPYQTLNVVPWPALPTSPPENILDLLGRQEPNNTICGYLGGQSSLPATCDLGSHCVSDLDHNVIGCCPNGPQFCTTGIFTGCADLNSGPQTEVNPYIFTCSGSDVCYRNTFDGGLSQWGCGTASDLATSVAATASGVTASLLRPTLSVSFTESTTSLSSPAFLGPLSNTGFSSTGISSTGLSSTGISSTGLASAAGISQPTPNSMETLTLSTPAASAASVAPSAQASTTSTASDAAPSVAGSPSTRTAAIAVGTIGGIAAVVLLSAAGYWFSKRQRGSNARSGPGSSGPSSSTQYISPMSGRGFAPVQQIHDGDDTDLAPGSTYDGPTDSRRLSYPPAINYDSPGQYPAVYAGAMAVGGGRAANRYGESDMEPLTREIDDFSRGFHDALGRIGEEDGERSGASSADLPVNERHVLSVANDTVEGVPYHGSMRPLWQQTRRQSRNMMWV